MDRTHNEIPNDLTIQDFEQLSNLPPTKDGDWIYRVDQYFLKPHEDTKYPEIYLDYSEDRIFLNYEEALKYIKEGPRENLYCSWITQIPIGLNSKERGAQWLFDRHGELLDYTTIHSFGEGVQSAFFGRTENRQRFKEGDIVEVLTRNKVRLAIVLSPVPGINHCWKIYTRLMSNNDNRFMDYGDLLDYSDDSTILLYGPSYSYHDHVSPLRLLKPRFEVSETLKEEMRSWVVKVKEEVGIESK